MTPDITVVATHVGALAAAGSGIVTIEGAQLADIPASLLDTYQQAGIKITRVRDTAVQASLSRGDLKMPLGITCDVWPGFPTDIAPIFSASIAGVDGTLRITDNIYDKRSAHVQGLNAMGYSLQAAGNVVTVHGRAPQALGEVTVDAPDIRSGAALLVGALGCTAQRVRITNYHQINRGYATLIEDLRSLGADIERV